MHLFILRAWLSYHMLESYHRSIDLFMLGLIDSYLGPAAFIYVHFIIDTLWLDLQLFSRQQINDFFHQPTIWWWMMENVQISRKWRKCAKNCILIREIQWRFCHPDTWSGNFKNVRISSFSDTFISTLK